MRVLSILAIFPLLALPVFSQKKPAASKAGPFVTVRKDDLARSFTLPGRFVPAGARPISLWFKAYQGDLVLTWVLPQGTSVVKGAVFARIDARAIDKQIRDLTRQKKLLDLSLAKAQAEDRLSRESEAKQVEAAARDLDRARVAFRMWEKVELPLAHRSEELKAKMLADRIQDQKDELEQLEKMYRQDELVDETEEIVLKRARRNLARTLESQAIQKAQLKHQRDYTEPLAKKKKEEALREMGRKLAQLKVRVQLAQAQRKADLDKLRAQLSDLAVKLADLRKDRRLFDLRAPAAGLLLYGSPQAYRPGGTPPAYRKGSRLAARTVLFTIAAPDKVQLALDVPEDKVQDLKERTAVEIRALAAPSRKYLGALRLERFPRALPGGKQVFRGLVEIEGKTPGLLPGMRAKVQVLLKPLKRVLLLPRTALFGSEGHWFCYAEKAGGAFEKVPVKTGPSGGGMVVIEKGLGAGQKVLLRKEAK